MKEIKIKIHEIKTDGLPNMDKLTGRVAFIFDGCVVSGWPLEKDDLWEADSDVSNNKLFSGVTHWIEFPTPIWEIK